MLIFGILPFTAWTYGPKWLHPYLIVLGVVALAATAVMLWRYIRDDRREMAAWPSRSEYRWPQGWAVPEYHRVLMTFLKIEDWRVLSAREVDADRLLLFVQRDRHHLPLLLVRPGIGPAGADLDLLHAIQREQGLWEAALITTAALPERSGKAGRVGSLEAPDRQRATERAAAADPMAAGEPEPPSTPTRAAGDAASIGAAVTWLDYEALPFLAEELDGGPEEERRAVAERRRATAAAASARARR